MGLLAGSGQDKGTVNYRHYEKCGTCMHFYQSSGTCDLVKGNISPDMVCNLWEIMSRKNEGLDGEFYKEQYAKNPGAFAKNLPGGGN